MTRQILRAYWHDYKSPCKYMITLTKRPEIPAFSSINIEATINSPLYSSKTQWSSLGKIIASHIYGISRLHPAIHLCQYTIMPDHIHFLSDVKSKLPVHLGEYIANLKVNINHDAGIKSVFDVGYNDQIITANRNLNDIYNYIRSNPYRLAVRMARPDFFRKQRNIYIGNEEMQGYGNLFLLRNPFKTALIVHRKDTPKEYEHKLQQCLYTAANGGVIVSPFISTREKDIKRMVEKMNGKIIQFHHRPFADRSKPALHDFELCSQGKLLLLSPISYSSSPPTEHPTREQCLHMNHLSEILSTCKNETLSPSVIK